MSVLDDLIIDRVPGAAYGWQDMNRVADAMEYVAGKLCTYGYEVEVRPQRFTREDFPTPSVMEHYLAQLAKLRGVLSMPLTTPPVPDVSRGRPYMTVQEANDIERILLDVNTIIERVVKGFRQCGQFTFWSGYAPLPAADSDVGRTWAELDDMDTMWANWQVATWYLLLYGDLQAKGVVD